MTDPAHGSEGEISDGEELSSETFTHKSKSASKPMMQFVPLLEDGPAPYPSGTSSTPVNNSGVRPAALGMQILPLL